MQHNQDPTEEIERLTKLAEDHLDGWKRAKADYLNLKKQSEKERQELAQFSQATAVIQFIPVYDSLRLAWEHVPNDQREQEWVKGFHHIQRQFADLLKQAGLKPIEPVPGQDFDPTKHHAVKQVKAGQRTSGQIVETVKLGWQADDKVLEPAQVTVAE